MKRSSFRRKALFRALHVAAISFLFWLAAQREAGAQTFTAPFSLSGTAATTADGTYSGNYGFYDPAHADTLTIGAGASVTNTSATGYGGASGGTSTPYAAVTLGAGTVRNLGTVSFQAGMATGSSYFAALSLEGTGSASVDNAGTFSASAATASSTIVVRGAAFYNPGSNSFGFTNEQGGLVSAVGTATASGSAYGFGLYSSLAAGQLTIANAGTIFGRGAYSEGTGTHTGQGMGIRISETSGFTTVANTGTISGYGSVSGTPYSLKASGFGIKVNGSAAGAGLSVTSSGTIQAAAASSVNATDSAYGVYFSNTATSRASVSNSGTIAASASGPNYAISYGVYLSDSIGTATLTESNRGTIQAAATSASGSASAFGLYAYGPSPSGVTTASLSNSGSIVVSGTGGPGNGVAEGIYAGYGSGANSIRIVNDGTIAANGAAYAYGIQTYGTGSLSSVYVRNTGSIAAGAPTSSYGIWLTTPGTIYNTGSITAGTAAIAVPSGSAVTLAGESPITGLIKGGADASSTSLLNLNVTVRSNYDATVAAVRDALVSYASAYAAANGTGNVDGSVVINGRTYTFEDFGTVAQALVDASYTHVPGFSSLGAGLDSMANSANAHAVALLEALDRLPSSSLPAALVQLSPAKVVEQLTTQPFHQALFQNLQLGNRLTQVRQGLGGGADWSGLQYVDAADPLLSQVQGKLYAYNPVRPATVTDVPAALSSGEQFNRWGTFLTGNAVLANQDATATQTHVDSTTVDLTAGADYRLDRNWAVGFLFGYGRTAASVDDFGSRVRNDQYRFGPYVGYNDGPWYANGSGYFAFNDQQSKRAIPVLGETAQATPSGTQYGLASDGGYEFKALDGRLAFGPAGGLQYTHLDIDSYTESGSSADLHMEAQHADSLISSLGGKADYDLHWKWNNATVRPELRAAWLHEFMGNGGTINAAFDVPGSASFTVASQRQQRDSALVGAGVQNVFPGGSLLYLDYDAQVGIENYLAQSITGGFKITF